jgi:hypothetical protein
VIVCCTCAFVSEAKGLQGSLHVPCGVKRGGCRKGSVIACCSASNPYFQLTYGQAVVTGSAWQDGVLMGQLLEASQYYSVK